MKKLKKFYKNNTLFAYYIMKGVKMKRKLSHSAITTYLDCQKKWDFVYNKGLKQDNIHLQFGSMAHKVLETKIIPDEILYPELKEFFGITSWKKYFTDILKEIDAFMQQNNLEQIGSEVDVEDDNMVGCIDCIYKIKGSDKYIIADYKFSNNIKGYEELIVDEQMYIYAWLYHLQTGIPIENISTCYINIPKVQLDAPRVLKNGKLSQDKAQNTTYEAYLEAINKLGLDVKEYEGILEELKNKKYVVFTLNSINLDALERVFENIENVIKDMQKPYILEKNSYMCTKCDFYEYCKLGKEIKK